MSDYGRADIAVGDGVPDWEPDAEDVRNVLYYNLTNNHLYSWDGSAWSDRDAGGGGGGLAITDVYPVDSIYIEVSGVNPATTFGAGTWIAFGTGAVPVGFSSGDPDFGTVEATGGEKTHQLTETEMPSHSHPLDVYTTGSGTAKVRESSGSGTATSTAVQDTGGDEAHNNLQPFIVVYMWKRTA